MVLKIHVFLRQLPVTPYRLQPGTVLFLPVVDEVLIR